MTARFVVGAAVLTVLAAPARGAPPADPHWAEYNQAQSKLLDKYSRGKVVKSHGEVFLRPSDCANYRCGKPAGVGTQLKRNDRLYTLDGTAELSFIGGGNLLVRENTMVALYGPDTSLPAFDAELRALQRRIYGHEWHPKDNKRDWEVEVTCDSGPECPGLKSHLAQLSGKKTAVAPANGRGQAPLGEAERAKARAAHPAKAKPGKPAPKGAPAK